jgi:hypothetical protein
MSISGQSGVLNMSRNLMREADRRSETRSICSSVMPWVSSSDSTSPGKLSDTPPSRPRVQRKRKPLPSDGMVRVSLLPSAVAPPVMSACTSGIERAMGMKRSALL